MARELVLALDLGGTKLSAGVFDGDGRLLGQKILPLEGRAGKEVGRMILEVIGHFEASFTKSENRIGLIGIAVPGIYNPDDGVVWAPNIEGWESYRLLDEICKATSFDREDVIIDSDRACYVLGETWQGVSKGCLHAIYLAVGTGIGAGILVGGRLLRGQSDIAGAIGWMAVKEGFLDPYDRYGCFEYHASGQGIELLGRKVAKEKNHRFSGMSANQEMPTTADIFRAYKVGDPEAISIIEDAILCWGQASANLISLFNPEIIVFGGGVFGPATEYIQRIYVEAYRWAQPISSKQVRFAASELGENVALYGAAYQAMNTRHES